jgi:sirohydrochlorin cobaltochelatase
MKRAIILVGHGAAAADTPRPLVQRLKALEGQRRAAHAPMSDEERALDQKLRSWPRTDETDPYRAGVLRLAVRLAARAGTDWDVLVAFNEFCAPTVEESFAQAIVAGAREVVLVPTMMTPGGVHSEVEIPEIVAGLRAANPDVRVRYAWPFELDDVAGLLERAVIRAADSG